MRILLSFISARTTNFKSCSQGVKFLIHRAAPRWKALLVMIRTLAPLRRIVSRDIEIFRTHNDKPISFLIHDRLECGHIFTDFQWGFLDLINPYSEVASKKRHQCRDCARTLVKKAPCTILMAQQRKMA